jgi:predicted nucleic acid-binding protein
MQGAKFMLDTNVVDEIVRKGFPPRFIIDDNALYLSEPIVYEYERRLVHIKAERKLKDFREQVIPITTVINPEQADWRAATLLWAHTQTGGKPLGESGDMDLLIAAICIRLNITLITKNIKHFAVMPNLPYQDWATFLTPPQD